MFRTVEKGRIRGVLRRRRWAGLSIFCSELERVAADVKEVREMERVILNGLKGAGYFHFDRPMIERLACHGPG